MTNKGEEEFAIIGLGRFGLSAGLALVQRGCHVLGIDSDTVLVQRYADELTYTVALDATDEQALRAAEITSFDTVIVAIGTNFEASVLTTVTLKGMGVRRVICKALTNQQAEVLRRVGADRVILPEEEAGQRLALELSLPRLLDQMVMAPGYTVAEVQLPDRLDGNTLAKSELREQYNVMVLAIRSGSANTVAPPPDFVLHRGDVLVILGPDQAILQLSQGQ